MFAELVEFITQLTEANASPAVSREQVGPLEYRETVEGVSEPFSVASPRATRQAYSPEAMAKLILAYGEHTAVYVGADAITAVLDNETRSESVIMPLERTNGAATLNRLIDGVTQKELVKILRTSLFGACPESFLKAVRGLEFLVEKESNASYSPGRESMGKSIDALKTKGEAGLPEIVTFVVPPYSFANCRTQELACAVVIDYDAEKIHLVPVGDEYEAFFSLGRENAIDRLTKLVDDTTLVVEGDFEITKTYEPASVDHLSYRRASCA